MVESQTVEYKREYSDTIKRTVMAFANTDGGTIYVGLDDDGAAVGVEDIDRTQLEIINSIRDGIRPDVSMFVEYETVQISGKPILCVRVQRGTARPYYLSGKGIRSEGVWVRQGASTVPASETLILRLIRDSSGDSFEEMRSLNQELSFCDCAAFFEDASVPFDTSRMRSLGLIGPDGVYTNLALLLSDQNPSTIKVGIFQGRTMREFKDRAEFGGSLFKQLQLTYDVLDRYNAVNSHLEGLYRIDRRDYPEDALREALLNLLAHRDYGFRAPGQVNIFEDRMEFINFGGLIKGMSYGDMMLGISAARNMRLVSILYRLRLVESYGAGIPRMFEAYEESESKPTIQVSDDSFKLILPNFNYKNDLALQGHAAMDGNHQVDDESKVLSQLNRQGSIKRSEVETLLGSSRAKAGLVLRELLSKDLIRKVGSGPSTEYVRSGRQPM